MRGAGRSGGGPHDMAQAVADLETVRRALGIDAWLVLGHSWGSDLAVRYALEHPALVPRGDVQVVPGAVHDFWSTDPSLWREVGTDACRTIV